MVISLIPVTKWLMRKCLREEGYFMAHNSRVLTTVKEKAWQQEFEAGGICSQGAERDDRWCSAHLFLSIQSGPSQSME